MAHLIKPCQKIHGSVNLLGDKSISHRAVILSSIAKGKTIINNFNFSDDCKATVAAFKDLGVRIKRRQRSSLWVYGVGRFGLRRPKQTIHLCESGTSIRILAGLLCAQSFKTKLDGDKSLRKRPMLRVIRPLKLMGAKLKARKSGRDAYPPISIFPSSLKPLKWKMDIASAQVKSAVLLAGLYAKGTTEICEPIKSRDHTERMLKYFKADIKTKEKRIYIKPSDLISPKSIYIPSDISSASFFIVLACLLKNSCIRIKNLCLNPLRMGVIDVIRRMGGHIKIIYKNRSHFEPMGDVVVKSSRLKAITVSEKLIPTMIDELPILMVAASLSKGRSVFKGVDELRVKETDRIRSMVDNLSKMGVKIETKLKANKEVIIIKGGRGLEGGFLKSYKDHRTAMSLVIAALCADSPSKIDDIECIGKSFPGFLKILRHLIVF